MGLSSLLQLRPEDVEVAWSKESGRKFIGSKAMLRLADCLAHHLRNAHLRNGPSGDFVRLLEEARFKERGKDITEIVLREIDPSVRSGFAARTGQK